MNDSTQRFSNRVANYVKYRPGYPSTVLDLLRRDCGLRADSLIADIGSGTGILTRLFLDNGNTVFAVEPNDAMRGAAEGMLGNRAGFRSVNGTAENTGLAAASADFIVAAQAFHWFDRERARREFVRVLKPGGWAVLIWNDRRTTSTPFLRDYEALLQDCSLDYAAVDHKQVDAAAIRAFFAPNDFRSASFENFQECDFEGVKGHLLSSSYAPEPGHPKYAPMLEMIDSIFRQHARDGRVIFEYDTLVYYGNASER